MPETVDCPYCKKPNNIAECMGDCETQEMTCRECDKPFRITCHLTTSYTTNCMENEHVFEELTGKYDGYRQCTACGYFDKIPKESK